MKKQLKNIMQIVQFRYFLIVVLFITATIQFLFMTGNVRGITYDIQLLQLAPETIRSVKTVEDTVKTERERDNAEKSVEPVYVFNEEVVDHRTAIVTSVFDIVLDVRRETKDDTIEKKIEELKEGLKDITEAQNSLSFSNTQLEVLLTIDEELLIHTKESLAQIVENALDRPFRKDQILTIRNEIDSKIRQQSTIAEPLLNTAITLGRAAIIETEVLDEEKTALRVRQAREMVEPTRILQGQIIVQEGELIDREVYRQLELLGMLDTKESLKPVFGLLILIFLQMSFIYIVFDRSKKPIAKRRNELLVTTIVYTLCIVMMKLMSIVAVNFDVIIAFLFPTALATMLIRLLVNDRVAAIITVMTATSAGIMFHSGYAAVLQMDIALYILFGGFAMLYFMRNLEKRSALLQACGILAIMNILFISFYLLMSQTGYGLTEVGFYFTAAVISAVLSGALTMGLLPFFESAFGILSTMRLIELSNPNHPLLRKLLTETPGTYHHSIMVANLAEAACEAIGADGLLARVGCYYHDLGKTRRPTFFIENQMSGINPHDTLPPQSSADIIIAHTTDGAALLRKHKMPQEIIDIALQHHGTSLLKFFVYKAKEEGMNVDESAFRYPGPKPQTKEAAVISIADSVEAAVRSMKEPTAEKIKKLIQSIIQDRVQDDQFDECDISLKELKLIEDVLCTTLNGTFHSRIEYPK
ncbi:HD family phosphohydrolase [Metasolibacillus sp.]|uniref:HD family phosphohydrolase n=1 Tax=Metasolibacillus sp. TaxID=2703680 RepID=UPI0025D03C64|nr:HD family phosphohydrolase [Metasolibacillus sp.]MCT6923325.1 HD family phosphohydrolase [Metasolibacillus sp.]MCT6939370.1 HD family phosphohydrolase [Metasolibacillus sp.]